MSEFFVDTSALAKRYLTEIGSTWMTTTLHPSQGHSIIVCDITPIELFSLIARRHREGQISSTEVTLLQNGFLGHLHNEYLTIAISPSILVQARSLVSKHVLRSLDPIQLAGALQAVQQIGQPLTFLCADKHLLTAAAAEGFQTDNPNRYP